MSGLRLGKLPARANSMTFRLRDYLSLTQLPSPPAKMDRLKLVTIWDMLGNDQYGDCVLAGGDHETMIWNVEAGKYVRFNTANALSDYSAITGFNPKNPDSDQGTDMQAAASYRRRTGLLDNAGRRHKVAAYLSITPGNKLEVKQAVYLFGALGIGIQFPASAMDQFNAGKPWTVVAGSNIEGGHYVPAIGYDADYVYCVTWGKVQKMSWAFLARYMDEGAAYVTQERLVNDKSREGFSFKQLSADLAALK